ncbi:MAG: lipoprotein [Pseudomonadota bacterium]
MRKLNHAIALITIILLTPLLSACGQDGPLYHPGQLTRYGPPDYSIFHSASYYAKQKEKQEQEAYDKKYHQGKYADTNNDANSSQTQDETSKSTDQP